MTTSPVPAAAPVGRRSPAAKAFLVLIGVYRAAISPARPPVCRYYPSCSAYAMEAIELHGAARGSLLAARRLLRCHPFHAGGHDPVPPPVERSGSAQSAEPVSGVNGRDSASDLSPLRADTASLRA